MKDGSASRAFLGNLQREVATFGEVMTAPGGDWTVRGFIDIFHNVYAMTADTKVVSKLIELMLFPKFLAFADQHNLKIVPCVEQNHYPDITFIDCDDRKYAVDLKSTYRASDSKVNTMTLGAFTGYFRNRTSSKNTTFPYGEYSGHYVVGVIYRRSDNPPSELCTFGVDDVQCIPSVVHDLVFFAQPKYCIATDRPGSGNTKNIGAVTDYQKLITGAGPFADLGEKVFDDYWMFYETADMALAQERPRPPYNNLATYRKHKTPPSGDGQ